MPRYIDADALNRAKFHPLPYTHIIPAYIKDVESYQRGWNDAIDAIIENAPTADVVERKIGKCISGKCVSGKDVVEVVRCKDCIHYWKNWKDGEPDYGDEVAMCLCSPKDDAFCSEGVLKEANDGEIH